jgi:hypothetical protein
MSRVHHLFSSWSRVITDRIARDSRLHVLHAPELESPTPPRFQNVRRPPCVIPSTCVHADRKILIAAARYAQIDCRGDSGTREMGGSMVWKNATTRAALLAVAGVTLMTTAACSDEPAGPTDAVAGSYEAAEWIITTDADSWDLLEGGGHLRITLNPDGTTTGEYFIPAGVSPAPGRQPPDGGEVDRRVDLAGTWTFDGDVVTFDHPTDTYLKFVDWEVVQPGELFNVHVNGGYTFRTDLRR